MGKQSDAKRKAVLKKRGKKAKELASKLLRDTGTTAAAWFKACETEPTIIAELIDEDGATLASVEESDDESWTVIVDGEATAGTNDEFVALTLLLSAAADDKAAGSVSYLQFTPWLVQAIEDRCEQSGLGWEEFLVTLLPIEKRTLALPQVRAVH